VYTGTGGETNNEDLNTMTWDNGSVPPKDEINNVYAIAHPTSGTVPGGGTTDTVEIFFGGERVVNNGDSHIDFEFLQNTVSLLPNAGTCNGGKFSGHRAQGDLLLSVDFTSGGTLGGDQLYKWDCGSNAAQGTICDSAKGKNKPQYVAVSSSAVKFGVNANSAVPCGQWVCRNTDGSQTPSVPQNDFMEGGLKLSEVGFTGCINTFLPHTRSSQSFTSTLKDFGGPVALNTCKQTVKIKKVDSRDSSVNLAATFKLFYDADANGYSTTDTVVNNTAGNPTCTTNATDGIGDCIFDVTQSGDYYAVEQTPPAGYQTADPVRQAVTVGTSNTNTPITIVVRDTPAPGSIRVVKLDDTTPTANAIPGVQFNLLNDLGTTGTAPEATTDTLRAQCTTTNTAGSDFGTCTFADVPPGEYWVTETTSTLPSGIIVGDTPYQHVTVTVAGGGDNHTVTFHNKRTFKVIVLVCKEYDNSLYKSSVTFNGTTKTTTGTASPFNENDLCTKLGGAAYGGLPADTYTSGTVVIGQAPAP
jgi:hypothetical protein